MRTNLIKRNVIMLLLIMMTVSCNAAAVLLSDKYSDIQIKHTTVQGVPRENSIQATIDGHTLSVVFLENLGQVAVEVTTANGDDVDATSIYTPNGVNFYITNTGSYIVTFTLPNGDEYYGEFEVTD